MDGSETVYGVAPRILARVAGGLLAALVTLGIFMDSLIAWIPLVWPPGGPRWATIALLWLTSLVVPVVVGSLLGGYAYEYYSS